MDKSWMKIKDRITSKEYKEGVKSFIEFAKASVGIGDYIWCPCMDCMNDKKQSPQIIKIHLILKGISPYYVTWVQHGESVPVHDNGAASDNHCPHSERVGDGMAEHNLYDELPSMVEDVYMGVFMDDDTDEATGNIETENVSDLDKLFDNAQRPLYIGCKNFTVLSFVVKMLHIKVQGKWSNTSFNMVMKVIKDMLPDCDDIVPWTIYDSKKFLHDLGLGYVNIHACINDCALFWKENAHLENCPKCGYSQYKWNGGKGKKIPHKILRYLPLTPRLKRLYMTNKTAIDMRWHKEKRIDDATMRHPADGEEWKNFDCQHPTFSRDPRNVRLGLATDGFNPFGNMSTSYSMWLVIVMPYNLPPWKCMKEPFCMLSLLIPRKTSPRREIDVYLRPLIDELKELWDDGVKTYDASSRETFRMRAAVMWTINDFPAYGNLSGWSTKGYLACPICNENASLQGLRNKIGYVGARRFLPENHIWRRSKLFNGKFEDRSRPVELSGEEILEQINLGRYKEMGKDPANKKRKRGEVPILNWNKRSIFFELPYWKTLKLRHCLDVMHIEKNFLDNLIGTLLSIEGKNKDTDKARLDLADMHIRKELHLRRRENGSYEKPSTLYTLSSKERLGFLDFLKSIKFPDGYAANISSCVNIQGGKLSGLKSHDCHVLLQKLLPVGMRGYINKELGTTLFELGNFFEQICSKTLKKTNLEKLEDQIILVLCKLEKIFPPAFFDVMVHLTIHLPRKAILGGPVQYRWMYPIERLLGILKRCVSNKARPEGSIVEAYISKECTTFCSMYLDGIETTFNREERNYDGGDQGSGLAIFTQSVRPFGLVRCEPDVSPEELEMAHWFVLYNSSTMDLYLEEHKNILQNESEVDITKRQRKKISTWFTERMTHLRNERSLDATDELWSLANGPRPVVNIYSRCISNGVRFHTMERDSRRKSQNSGLVVEGDHEGKPKDFYGYLCKVWELTYLVFQCEWFNTGSSRNFSVDAHCTSINVRNRWYKDDPFVLPSQVQKVFYINDTADQQGNWKVVQRFHHRGIWDVTEMEDLDANDGAETGVLNQVFQQEETNEIVPIVVEDPIAIPLHRQDMDAEVVQVDVLQQPGGQEQAVGSNDDDFICDEEEEEESMDEEEAEEMIFSDSDTDHDY